jgi:NAD(P)-dependent dehydrogenase (short-subunit alcohol dehydrogenase family)
MRILVVGASGTIGRAVVEALAEKHDVLRASRNGPAEVDITRPTSIKAMFAALGKLDGVVCCAGRGVMRPLMELTDEDIQTTLAGKLWGQMNLVRLGVDYVNDSGVFLLTAGFFSKSPIPGVSAVAMVNGAIESFARGAALDLPRGIRLNTVSPPWIKETAEALGVPGGLPAADNAEHYVRLIEGKQNGVVVFPAASESPEA